MVKYITYANMDTVDCTRSQQVTRVKQVTL